MKTTRDVLDRRLQCFAGRDVTTQAENGHESPTGEGLVVQPANGSGRHSRERDSPCSTQGKSPHVTPDEYRSVMRCWPTGVTIVTTSGPDGPHGMTASSFTGVSLDPPLILICVGRQTRTHEHVLKSGVFGVHLLHSGQEELSNRCAGLRGQHGGEIADLPHVTGPFGVPVLDDCLAALVCRVHTTYDGGDHTIFLGAVHAARPSAGAPLVYLDRGYHRIVTARPD